MEGGRLSQPRHCSKGVQLMPKAVYRSDCRNKFPAARFQPASSHTTVRHVIIGTCMLFMILWCQVMKTTDRDWTMVSDAVASDNQ